MRLLVRSWCDGGRSSQKNHLIVENVLGKKTRARAQDVYQEIFYPRFIKGDPPKAWKIARILEDRELPFEIIKPVYYWITARSDRLLYDFVIDEILPKSKSTDLTIRVDETNNWITKRLSAQKQSWSKSVTIRVAQGFLAALRDFEILEGATKKSVAPVYLPVESFAYLCFCLHESGNTGERLIKHSDWKLFLMEPPVVERLFLEAHQNRLLHYEAAGKLYRIEFFARNMEEMADVIAGRRD
ncbi:MAG: DUF1819 family protein [Deltaproteobacteria bacterium]|nr:DUF1819 family protein [Deltaproteobacteria bacterium]